MAFLPPRRRRGAAPGCRHSAGWRHWSSALPTPRRPISRRERSLGQRRGGSNCVTNRADFTRGPVGPQERFWRRDPSLNELSRPSLAGALIEDRFPLASEATGVASLAGRYAAALFDLADEWHALDAVAGDLRELRAMLQASPDLVRLLRSPVLSRDEQGQAIAAVSERAGLSELTP